MYCRENGNATRGAVELRAEMPNEINTIQNAWNVICEFEYLVEADHSARKGKRYRAEVLAFTANLEHNLFQIQEQMIAVDCPLGPYRKLWVSVPKKRLVMALPYPDRIVQWSLYQYLNPVTTGYLLRTPMPVAKAREATRPQHGYNTGCGK